MKSPGASPNVNQGRLSSGDVVFGMVCAAGLLIFCITMTQYTVFYLAHNSALLLGVGVLSLLASPLWLLAMAIEAIRFRKNPWRPIELGTIGAVAAALSMAVLSVK